MKNVIHVDFKSKTRIDQPAAKKNQKPKKVKTKGELHVISKRVDEINAALDLCHPDFDSDIMYNLEVELSGLEQQLRDSLEIAEQNESRGA